MEELGLRGCLAISPFSIEDARGEFVKHMDAKTLRSLGFKASDIFYSVNRKNTVRGLHYQLPKPQAKIVFCPHGRIYDVAVDIRKGSPTFGKYASVELSSENKRAIYIPAGFAHGFACLEEGSVVMYLADGEYRKDCDLGIRFDDPDIGIDWPVDKRRALLSERDSGFPFLKGAKTFGDV